MKSLTVRHVTKSVLLAAVLWVPAACGSKKPADISVPVPERDRRLEYNLDLDRSRIGEVEQARDVVAEAIDDTVCLLRTERPLECQEPDPDATVCSTRSEQEIREAIEPTFSALREITLTSSELSVRPGGTTNHAIHEALALVASGTAPIDACRQLGVSTAELSKALIRQRQETA